jgi:hypothetical protein
VVIDDEARLYDAIASRLTPEVEKKGEEIQ